MSHITFVLFFTAFVALFLKCTLLKIHFLRYVLLKLCFLKYTLLKIHFPKCKISCYTKKNLFQDKLHYHLYVLLECPDDKFGPNCTQLCSCSSDPIKTNYCDKINGTCFCHDGWNGNDCENDIDECQEPGRCPGNSTCVNTDGSFICDCDKGFFKNDEGNCQSEC